MVLKEIQQSKEFGLNGKFSSSQITNFVGNFPEFGAKSKCPYVGLSQNLNEFMSVLPYMNGESKFAFKSFNYSSAYMNSVLNIFFKVLSKLVIKF